MTNRIHRLVLAVSLSGLCCGAWAQSGPNDAPPPNAPPAPQMPAGPHAHDWSGANGGYRHDGDGHDGDGHDWHGHDWHGHHHCDHGWKHHGEHGAAWGGMGLMRDLHELNLSEAQHTQLRGIVTAAHEQMMHQHEHMGAQSGAASPLAALANPGDPNYANAVEAAKKLAVEHIQQRSDFELKLYGVLTPAQKAQLTKLIAQRRAKRAEWAAHHEHGDEHGEHGDHDHGVDGPPMTH